MTETDIRKPGRPRSVQADRAILDATLELIADMGIQGMSLEAVAARAGVSKTTIYRRWPNKDALVVDALIHIKAPVATFDTGNLRDDIKQYMRYLLGVIEDPLIRRLSLRILGELAGNPEWSRAFEGSLTGNLQGLLDMVKRGVARGEVLTDADPQVIVELIGGSLMYYFLVSFFLPDNLPPFDVDATVELLWKGLAPYRTGEQGSVTGGSAADAY